MSKFGKLQYGYCETKLDMQTVDPRQLSRAGYQRTRASIPDGNKICISQCPHRLWGPPKSMQCGYSEDISLC